MYMDSCYPPSPSDSSDSSDLSLQLDPSTLSTLNDFLVSRSEEKQQYDLLSQIASARQSGLDDGADEEMMDVDDYKRVFSEDWQLSQFWYSTAFATHLAGILHENLKDIENPTIAFLCSPTAFVSFLSHPLYKTSHSKAVLLEYDKRFDILPGRYVFYDLEKHQEIPDDLTSAVDLAVVDPPFLNERTHTKVCQSLNKILRKHVREAACPSRVLLLSAPAPDLSEDDIVRVYNGMLEGLTQDHDSVSETSGKVESDSRRSTMKETSIKVEHAGGRLKNDFKCWASWDISVPG